MPQQKMVWDKGMGQLSAVLFWPIQNYLSRWRHFGAKYVDMHSDYTGQVESLRDGWGDIDI